MEFSTCCKRCVPFIIFCRTVFAMTFTDYGQANEYIKELDSFYGTFHSQADALEVVYYTPTRQASDILRHIRRVSRKRPPKADGRTRKPFVVIEGLYAEGGRRAISCFLASRFNGIHLENPPQMYYEVRHGLMHHSNRFRRAFFALANYVVAKQAMRWLTKRPVFLSRYWHNFATYAIAKATANKTFMMPPKNSLVYSWPSDLLKPDFVFFVNTTTQDQRDYWNIKGIVKGFQQRRVEAFSNMYDPFLVDISGEGTLSETANRIIDYLIKTNMFY